MSIPAVAMALEKALGVGRGDGGGIGSGKGAGVVAEKAVATLVRTKPPSPLSLENLSGDRRDLEWKEQRWKLTVCKQGTNKMKMI